MTEKRFENRLNKDIKKFQALNPVWDNELETAWNVFDMIGLLNNYDKEYKSCHNDVLRLEKENGQLKETINDLRVYDEEEYIEAKHLNNIYKEFGFDGVIKEVKSRLVYGTVTEMDNLIRISTGGWSDDEALLDVLISSLTQFSYHYVGYIVGGAFYFDPDKSIESFGKVKLIKEGQ